MQHYPLAIADELKNVHDIFTLMGHDLGMAALEIMVRKYETMATEFLEGQEELYARELARSAQTGHPPAIQ